MFEPTPPTAADKPRRLPYAALAGVCVGLGAAGLVLPLWPTTPFLLVAAWAAARGSPRLHAWLYRQPAFAGVLTAWRDQRAVPAGAKRLACLLMASSWAMLWWLDARPGVLAFTGVLFLCVGGFLLTRPGPSNPMPTGR